MTDDLDRLLRARYTDLVNKIDQTTDTAAMRPETAEAAEQSPNPDPVPGTRLARRGFRRAVPQLVAAAAVVVVAILSGALTRPVPDGHGGDIGVAGPSGTRVLSLPEQTYGWFRFDPVDSTTADCSPLTGTGSVPAGRRIVYTIQVGGFHPSYGGEMTRGQDGRWSSQPFSVLGDLGDVSIQAFSVSSAESVRLSAVDWVLPVTVDGMELARVTLRPDPSNAGC